MEQRILSRSQHPISRKAIDRAALNIIYRLYNAGHTAYLVGGGVRDMLLGRPPKDFDIATSARPAQIRLLFPNCRLIGRRFRLAHIYCGAQKVIEVSTFRRWPDPELMAYTCEDDFQLEEGEEGIILDNTFGSPQDDARRRDFTVNGLYYDVGSYSVLDYVGGTHDIEHRLVRTIGDPDVRFREDPVRMLRAIKFCAKLHFEMEEATWRAIRRHHADIAQSSLPRVQEELQRLLELGNLRVSLRLLLESGLLRDLVPNLDRNLNHLHDQEAFESLLDLYDQEGVPSDRTFSFAVLVLSLILDGDRGRSSRRHLARDFLEPLSDCFGICRRTQEEVARYLSDLQQLLYGAPKGRERGELLARPSFINSFKLYQMLAQVGAVSADQYAYWRECWENREESSWSRPAPKKALKSA